MKKYSILRRCFFLAFSLIVVFNIKLPAQMKSGNMHKDMDDPMKGNDEADRNQFFNPKDSTDFIHKLNIPGESGLMGVLEMTSPQKLNVIEQKLTIVPGKETALMLYQADQNGKVFLNPILRVKKGAEFSLLMNNGLKEKTIIHWHGLKTAGKNDGLPQDAVQGGKTYQYKFTINNNPGTYWFHPHPHGLTGKQVYSGLASFLIVEDEQSEALEKSLGLKFGETDIPLLIQDKRFDKDGRIIYNPNRTESFMGFYGDTILVNLTPKPLLTTNTSLYRFRLLNGSNARVYRLAFVKDEKVNLPFSVIANDGGLLDKPYQVTEVYLSPGERTEILLDLRKEALGAEIYLKSLAFDPMENEEDGMGNMMMDQMSGMSLPNGDELYLLKLVVKEKAGLISEIPEKLADLPAIMVDKSTKVRKIELTQQHMQWFMNGKKYNLNEFPIEVTKGKKEIWEFINHKSSMPHPMHIHGFPFQVLERKGSPLQVRNIALADKKGMLVTDLGYKDTVLVWPGETVRVLIDFSHNDPGDQNFVFHCHILEHEDGGMMLNYRVLE